MLTKVPISKPNFLINFDTKILTIGSCFSDSMGQKLNQNLFNCISNPFGTLFNSASIFKLLSKTGSEYALKHIFEKKEDGFYSYALNSSVWNENKIDLESNIDIIHKQSIQDLQNSDVLIITLGTSWVYEKEGEVIANCQKMPQSLFTKRLITSTETIQNFKNWYSEIIVKNPKLKIILTVSPVRHIKDTLVLNSVSKSHLLIACYELSLAFDHVYYFPSYEIVIDELRDYRYFNDDMIHPSELAQSYIWTFFGNTYFDTQTQLIVEKWQKICLKADHKPNNPKSIAHQNMIQKTIQELESFPKTKTLEQIKSKLQNQLIF